MGRPGFFGISIPSQGRVLTLPCSFSIHRRILNPKALYFRSTQHMRKLSYGGRVKTLPYRTVVCEAAMPRAIGVKVNIVDRLSFPDYTNY